MPSTSSACPASPAPLPRARRALGSGQRRGRSAPLSAAALTVVENAPYIYVGNQKAHSLHARGREVIEGMEGWAERELPRYLKHAETNWQPTDFLPNSASPDFEDQVLALRRAAANLPLDYLVVLVGDMVRIQKTCEAVHAAV